MNAISPDAVLGQVPARQQTQLTPRLDLHRDIPERQQLDPAGEVVESRLRSSR